MTTNGTKWYGDNSITPPKLTQFNQGGTPSKAAPVLGDRLLIDDSEDSYAKKYTTFGGMPSATQWLQSFYPNTPSTVTRFFGMSANGWHPGLDIRLLNLKVQFYSEQPVQSALRLRVYRYDANAATDRLILSVSASAVAVGYHNIEDLTPDLTYQDLDSSAGDTLWIELDNGSGSPAKRVREISFSLQYKTI